MNLQLDVFRLSSHHSNKNAIVDWLTSTYLNAIDEEIQITWANIWRQVDLKSKLQVRDMIEQVIDQERCLILIAQTNNKNVGYFIGVIKDCIGEIPSQVGYVNGIFLESEYRKAGFGQLLLDKSMQWFKKQGMSLVELYASIENEVSNNFWEKNGFRAVEKVYLKKIESL